MRTLIFISIAANFSFGIYYSVVDFTYLSSSSGTTKLSANWIFEKVHMARGIFYGLLSGALAFVTVFTMGLCRKLMDRIRQRVDAFAMPGEIFQGIFGGIVIGIDIYLRFRAPVDTLTRFRRLELHTASQRRVGKYDSKACTSEPLSCIARAINKLRLC